MFMSVLYSVMFSFFVFFIFSNVHICFVFCHVQFFVFSILVMFMSVLCSVKEVLFSFFCVFFWICWLERNFIESFQRKSLSRCCTLKRGNGLACPIVTMDRQRLPTHLNPILRICLLTWSLRPYPHFPTLSKTKNICSKISVDRCLKREIMLVWVKEHINKNFATCKSLCNLQEVYTAFKEKHPNVNIGSSKFCTLRPKWCVLAASKITHSVYTCSPHQNVVLLVDALDWDLTYEDVIKLTLSCLKYFH